MATLHFVVLKSRRTVKNSYVIYLAITHKRDVRYIATDYEIEDLYQFDKGKIVCRKDAHLVNKRLDYVLSEFKEKLNEIPDLGIYNCSQIKEILEGKQRCERLYSIKEYMEIRINRFRKEGRDSYADMNVYTLDKILSIIGDITLQSISPSVINKFISGMSCLSNATKQMRLTHLKACINEAIKEGIVKYDIHPFVYTKMPKSRAKQLDLTVEEFRRIKTFNPARKKLTLAKDLFLLSFYMGGMNLADIVKNDFGKLCMKYERTKTSNKKEGEKETVFTIPDAAKPIINKYLNKRNGKLDFGYKYSYSNFRRYVNLCLKELGKELNIETNICFYSGRKTFSQFAYELGIRTEIVEYCIGQSMKENRPIFNYIRVMQRQADAALQMVIDYTENPDKFELSIRVI